MTCFAVCASILPPAPFNLPVRILLPISGKKSKSLIFFASDREISLEGSSTVFTTIFTTYTLNSPDSVSNFTDIFCPDLRLSFLNVEDNASSTADSMVSLSKFRSAANCVNAIKKLLFITKLSF